MVIKLKKISRIFCKVLALSLVFTFNSKVDLMTSVNAMEAKAETKPIIHIDLNNPTSSVYEAMVKIAKLFFSKKGYDVADPFNHVPYGTNKSWEFECIKANSSKQEIIYENRSYPLWNFLNSTNNSTGMRWSEYVYILSRETELSLEYILLYLMTEKPEQLPYVIKSLMKKFSSLSDCGLEGDDRKKEIGEIKSIVMKFLIS